MILWTLPTSGDLRCLAMSVTFISAPGHRARTSRRVPHSADGQHRRSGKTQRRLQDADAEEEHGSSPQCGPMTLILALSPMRDMHDVSSRLMPPSVCTGACRRRRKWRGEVQRRPAGSGMERTCPATQIEQACVTDLACTPWTHLSQHGLLYRRVQFPRPSHRAS